MAKNIVEVKEIIEKYSDMVYRIALTRTKSIENAEDIFQEVFMKLSEKDPKFEGEEHLKAWLIRVTINLSKNSNSSTWNRKVTNLSEDVKFENEEESNVFEIVNDLPQNYRTVIYLFYYEGYKTKEIAQMMKKSEGTIKTWLFRARNELKEKMEGGFGDE